MTLKQLFTRGMTSLKTSLQVNGDPKGEYKALDAWVPFMSGAGKLHESGENPEMRVPFGYAQHPQRLLPGMARVR
jgi:hypothetical protein